MGRRKRMTEAEIDAMFAALSGRAGGGAFLMYSGPTDQKDPATTDHTPAKSQSDPAEIARRIEAMRKAMFEAALALGPGQPANRPREKE